MWTLRWAGYHSCVQLLLNYGAIADARDRVGVTALIAAVSNVRPDIRDKLFKARTWFILSRFLGLLSYACS